MAALFVGPREGLAEGMLVAISPVLATLGAGLAGGCGVAAELDLDVTGREDFAADTATE